MDHSEAVRLKATEQYFLQELDPDQLEQFEEHLFDCPHCALDVRAAAMFLEQSKNVLSRTDVTAAAKTPVKAREAWFSRLRPAFLVPAMAALLLVIAYQNLITYPRLQSALHRPQVMPWASVNVGTWGAGGPVVTTSPGKGFLLFVRIPPEGDSVRYTADLYNPAGGLEWSLNFPANPGQDQWPVQVPGATRQPGTYTLAVRGTTAAGRTKDLGRTSFELQIQQ
jgi:hypothetical protein